MVAQLRFAKLCLNKTEKFWSDILWIDETNVEMFNHHAQCHVWKPRLFVGLWKLIRVTQLFLGPDTENLGTEGWCAGFSHIAVIANMKSALAIN